MDWKAWLGFNLYKKLWSLIGGRQWTYIIRDFYHQHPILFTFIVMWSAYLLNKYVMISITDWFILSAGVLLGHLFWGTKYIPNQQEELIIATRV